MHPNRLLIVLYSIKNGFVVVVDDIGSYTSCSCVRFDTVRNVADVKFNYTRIFHSFRSVNTRTQLIGILI